MEEDTEQIRVLFALSQRENGTGPVNERNAD